MEIHDQHSYRDAITELHRLGDPEPGSSEERRRQALIAAIENYAEKSKAGSHKGKPEGSIPTRGR